MSPNDIVICNQAKALEGMRQRLKSHVRKFTECQSRVDRALTMVALRDERIAMLVERIEKFEHLNETWMTKYTQFEEISQRQSDAIGRLKNRLGI